MGEAVEAAKRADDAFNAHDLDARLAANSDDAEFVMPGGIKLRGREQADVLRAFWEALPDVTLTWETHVESGSMVAGEGLLAGTHTGPLRTPQGEIPATGRGVKLPYAFVRRVEGGKIASEHLYFDQMDFLGQLGALPQASG
ncbi:MAG TPA: nuclear transport factor 2 family protein [Gaiellaceae bacterium]|jgi:predicted ester cyclase|nr:nuclear transport factor 2 family protein [Gaiellaceae bacterium]